MVKTSFKMVRGNGRQVWVMSIPVFDAKCALVGECKSFLWLLLLCTIEEVNYVCTKRINEMSARRMGMDFCLLVCTRQTTLPANAGVTDWQSLQLHCEKLLGFSFAIAIICHYISVPLNNSTSIHLMTAFVIYPARNAALMHVLGALE